MPGRRERSTLRPATNRSAGGRSESVGRGRVNVHSEVRSLGRIYYSLRRARARTMTQHIHAFIRMLLLLPNSKDLSLPVSSIALRSCAGAAAASQQRIYGFTRPSTGRPAGIDDVRTPAEFIPPFFPSNPRGAHADGELGRVSMESWSEWPRGERAVSTGRFGKGRTGAFGAC